MSEWAIRMRIAGRWVLAMTLTLVIGTVLIILVTFSDQLEPIGEAGWGLFNLGMGGLTLALGILARAIAQNPSDRGKPTEEGD